jgi:tRNA 2-selenouridine synthase
LETLSNEPWVNHLLSGGNFLDVRAPVEFSSGAVPGAINIPLLNDEERQAVGTCYKRKGPGPALELGYQLVSGPTREERLQRWKALLRERPNTLLYCFRGGQRSKITQEWLDELGTPIDRVEGGYKKMRATLLAALEHLPSQLKLKCISGSTGSGKTYLLRELIAGSPHINIIDLEAIARHRGSAFGDELDPQPSQAQFENNLAAEFLRAAQRGLSPIWLEDESRTIGRVALVNGVFDPLRRCDLVVIEESRQSRARMILQEYVIDAYRARVDRVGEDAAWFGLREALLEPIRKISAKLGGSRALEVAALIDSALNQSKESGDWECHLPWIEYLLAHYYDGYYEKHMERQAERVVFRGSRAAVAEFVKSFKE